MPAVKRSSKKNSRRVSKKNVRKQSKQSKTKGKNSSHKRRVSKKRSKKSQRGGNPITCMFTEAADSLKGYGLGDIPVKCRKSKNPTGYQVYQKDINNIYQAKNVSGCSVEQQTKAQGIINACNQYAAEP